LKLPKAGTKNELDDDWLNGKIDPGWRSGMDLSFPIPVIGKVSNTNQQVLEIGELSRT
jgi:hypothetical protein